MPEFTPDDFAPEQPMISRGPDVVMPVKPAQFAATESSMRDSDRVELGVAAVDDDASLDDVSTAVAMVDYMKKWINEQDKELKRRLVLYIQKRGEFMIGEEKFYLGHKKETWCEDVAETVVALLGLKAGAQLEILNAKTGEAVPFNLESLTDCLSSDAFKPATTIKALQPADADRLFKSEMKTHLKREGTPIPVEVHRVNTKFIR